MAGFLDRLAHGWNAFRKQDEGLDEITYVPQGVTYSTRPDRRRTYIANERSIISAILTRLSVDVSAIDIRHVRLDDQERYIETISSGINTCLNLEANIDQAAQAFKQDIALTLFDKGVAAIVPTDTTLNPFTTGAFDILSMRVGEIVQWYPQDVRVSVWNEQKGRREEIVVPKRIVAIIENPFYQVMNEPNSTLQRLIRKLNLLDSVDEAASSGKLDIIIQLPYVIKSDARQQQAEQRREDLENQLKGSKYGVAYSDATEKITQLNRPAENNMLAQIEYLTKMLYGQLGLTESVFDGSADEATMLNYFSRTIEPVLNAITTELKRKFLTKTARSQGQSIEFFRDPFKLVPIGTIAELADKLTRNEIASSNDIRSVLGWKPSPDPKADQLVNSNVPQPQNQPSQIDSSQNPSATQDPQATSIEFKQIKA